jgi:hypothetical protein
MSLNTHRLHARFRNAYYEFFKVMHFISATLFVVFLFIHCNFRLSSWYAIHLPLNPPPNHLFVNRDYFIAAVGVYGISFLVRTYKAFIHNGSGLRAEFTDLHDDMLKVNIPIPPNKSRIHWKPGQHFFLRFLRGGLHQLTNHPFTIASVDRSAYPAIESADKGDESHSSSKAPREIVCYIRVKDGMTGRMATLCNSGQRNSNIPVLLDGPYGGMEGSLRVYDRALLLAGGSGDPTYWLETPFTHISSSTCLGGSFIIPVLEDLVMGFKSGQACTKIHVVWATKTFGRIKFTSGVYLI